MKQQKSMAINFMRNMYTLEIGLTHGIRLKGRFLELCLINRIGLGSQVSIEKVSNAFFCMKPLKVPGLNRIHA